MRMLYLSLCFFIACQTAIEEPNDQKIIADTTVTASLTAITPPADTPKVKPIDYDTNEWTELQRLDPTIVLDLRYAGSNNFVGEKMYDCGRCFLRPEVARAAVKAHRQLQVQGYGGLKMYDCYRPRPIQWKLWNKVPNPNYVADPRKGSMHNRGSAMDLTIVDIDGKELNMGTDFDFFGKEAYHDFTGHPQEILDNRKLLKETLEQHGFRSVRTEWWHYSYRPKSFTISDMLWECEPE